MRHPSPLTPAEIERYVDGVRRRHGRAGLLVLADTCSRALRVGPPTDTVNGRQRISLVGP